MNSGDVQLGCMLGWGKDALLQDPAVLSGEITKRDLDALSAEGRVVRGHVLG
jgi:hypothetical protein